MDLSVLIQPPLQYLVPVVLIATILSSPWFKGRLGEFVVEASAVPFSTENATIQVDHIIVFRYGKFMVEIKNMKNWVLWSEKQQFWEKCPLVSQEIPNSGVLSLYFLDAFSGSFRFDEERENSNFHV